jgi:hypothetical protein
MESKRNGVAGALLDPLFFKLLKKKRIYKTRDMARAYIFGYIEMF